MLSNEEYGYLETMRPEEKYRLYNECEFIVRNNYATLNYLSEPGLGKALVRFFSGGEIQAKGKIMENTAELQEKMKDILVYLDDDLLNVKLRVKYLSEGLLTLHHCCLHIINLLEDFAARIKYIDEFLVEQYPGYQQWDFTRAQSELNFLKANINSQIAILNRQEEEYYNRYQKEQKKIDIAKSNRILRITPYEATVITNKGAEVNKEKIKLADKFGLAVPQKTVNEWLVDKECKVAILPEYMYKYATGTPKGKMPVGLTLITPADYFMYLWFMNTSQNKRKGCCVCMLDMYQYQLYVYAYKVSDDGTTYSRLNLHDGTNPIPCGWARLVIRDELKKMFKEKYDETLFFRTFIDTTYISLIKRFGDNTVFTNKINVVDLAWENILVENDGEGLAMFVHNFINEVYNDVVPVFTK